MTGPETTPDPFQVDPNAVGGVPLGGGFALTPEQAESLVAPGGAEEPPAGETTAPAAEASTADPEFDIPGYGKMKASEILTHRGQSIEAREAMQQLRSLQDEQKTVAQMRQQAREAMELQKVMQANPDLRERIVTGIRDYFADPGLADRLKAATPSPESAGIPDELDSRLAPLEAFVREQHITAQSQKIDSILDGYEAKFPDIVNGDFKTAVLDRVYESFLDRPNDLTPQVFEAFVAKQILERGLPAAREAGRQEIVDALRSQPKGTTLVTGHATRRAAAPPEADPRRMSWKHLEDEAVSTIFNDEPFTN